MICVVNSFYNWVIFLTIYTSFEQSEMVLVLSYCSMT